MELTYTILNVLDCTHYVCSSVSACELESSVWKLCFYWKGRSVALMLSNLSMVLGPTHTQSGVICVCILGHHDSCNAVADENDVCIVKKFLRASCTLPVKTQLHEKVFVHWSVDSTLRNLPVAMEHCFILCPDTFLVINTHVALFFCKARYRIMHSFI